MKMDMVRISDGGSQSVVVPEPVPLTQGVQDGQVYTIKKVSVSKDSAEWNDALRSWAYRNGFIIPADDNGVVEEQVTVKQHQRKSSKGKLYQVRQHHRTTAEVESTKPAARQFKGVPIDTKNTYTKYYTGKIGEALALHDKGGIELNKFIGTKKNNLAFDLINLKTRVLYEVKAGNISNKPDEMKWRLTKGEPGKEERAFLKRAPEAIKRLHNESKEGAILARKLALHAEVERLTGHKYRIKTLTYILNPDKNTADSYEFDGLHKVIRWRNDLAKSGYKKTVTYKLKD